MPQFGPNQDKKPEQPKVEAPPRLPKPQSVEGLSSVAVPKFSELRADTFNKQIHDVLEASAAKLPVFRDALASAKKNGYEFVLYDKTRTDLPDELHTMMRGDRFGALTFADAKKVYINVAAISAHAKKQGISDAQQLFETLGNEAIHIVEHKHHTFHNPTQAKAIIATAAYAEGYTKEEKAVQDIIVEEIVSAMSESIVRQKFKDPKFTVTEKKFEGGYFLHFNDTKQWVSESVFNRALPPPVDPLSKQEKTERDAVKGRIDHFIRKGDATTRVMEMLTARGLVEK